MKYSGTYIDDSTVPESTTYYYARQQAYTGVFVGLIFVITGICFTINKLEGVELNLSWVLIPVGLYSLIRGYLQLKNRKPQIVLSAKGIETPSDGLVSWNHIDNAYIDLSGEDPCFIYLPYGQKKTLNLAVYGMDEENLDRKLAIYLLRYEQSIPRSL